MDLTRKNRGLLFVQAQQESPLSASAQRRAHLNRMKQVPPGLSNLENQATDPCKSSLILVHPGPTSQFRLYIDFIKILSRKYLFALQQIVRANNSFRSFRNIPECQRAEKTIQDCSRTVKTVPEQFGYIGLKIHLKEILCFFAFLLL